MTWNTYYYPADNNYLVSDRHPSVWGARILASFSDEYDAMDYAEAYSKWERELSPPNPEDFNGYKGFGDYCVVPACGNLREDHKSKKCVGHNHPLLGEKLQKAKSYQ